MGAEIISLADARRGGTAKPGPQATEQHAIDLLADRIARENPDLSEHACRALATRGLYRGRTVPEPEPMPQWRRPKPIIPPDHPVLDLYAAFKAAQAAFHAAKAPYDQAVSELAHRHQRTLG